jgi:hypothetical protein
LLWPVPTSVPDTGSFNTPILRIGHSLVRLIRSRAASAAARRWHPAAPSGLHLLAVDWNEAAVRRLDLPRDSEQALHRHHEASPYPATAAQPIAASFLGSGYRLQISPV